ncbi:hypothetical protein [Alteromonas sp. 14N.309.X.WAT.G.H12]|uniref:hypothetical protein n=1 Tax=Alteromonas sp. 14N.309.X.WAT.G.H12 TaxID=3120824 RepID=UPI002FD12158
MKPLTTLLTSLLFCCVSAHSQATSINLNTDKGSYDAGETVLLDVSIVDIDANAAELGFDLLFDETALSFDNFDFSTDILSSAFFYAADLSFFDNNIVEIFTLWFDSADLPASSFSLGQATFTATSAFDGDFSILDFYLADAFGNDIDVTPTSVPAPATGGLLLLACIFAALKRTRIMGK